MAAAFKEAFAKKDFVVTAEVGPPKGTDISELIEHIELLKDKVDGLNVTDNQSSVMRISSLAICRVILDHGAEPILQLTCRDRNRLALQSELLSAWVLGAKSVLCLTGDYISVGDHPQAKPVFDLDSVQLLQTVGSLNQGRDLAGNEMQGATDFFAGAVVTPEADPIEPQMIKFEKKIAAGAKFIQTQAIYGLDNFRRFMERARTHDAKIMAGIVLLVSAGMARGNGPLHEQERPGHFRPRRAGQRDGRSAQGETAAGRHPHRRQDDQAVARGEDLRRRAYHGHWQGGLRA
jgi:5,10-methylenetetrahydrofolate reductase